MRYPRVRIHTRATGTKPTSSRRREARGALGVARRRPAESASLHTATCAKTSWGQKTRRLRGFKNSCFPSSKIEIANFVLLSHQRFVTIATTLDAQASSFFLTCGNLFQCFVHKSALTIRTTYASDCLLRQVSPPPPAPVVCTKNIHHTTMCSFTGVGSMAETIKFCTFRSFRSSLNAQW